ncbi:MAG: hypothetical protein LUI10_00780 [Lachnospiraceae bacterium]|nr:hypothetical protein [Lachnospiraceae bacterium]
MTRGKIIYITEHMQVYSTIEFNGDMYPFDGGHGEEIVEYFLKRGFRDIYSYQAYVKRMDERYFGYAYEYGRELIHYIGSYRDGLLDFSRNYTDYLYLINHAGQDIQIVLKDGRTTVPDGALAIVYYQELREIIPGSDTRRSSLQTQNKLLALMDDMDWDLYLKQKEWLYAQQTQIEKWYGREASALPVGILNMMDRIQDAWEEEAARADANECWYEEKWYDEDLRIALEEAGVDVTAGNVAKLKKECLHIFDDKSKRNEMLVGVARELDGNT